MIRSICPLFPVPYSLFPIPYLNEYLSRIKKNGMRVTRALTEFDVNGFGKVGAGEISPAN